MFPTLRRGEGPCKGRGRAGAMCMKNIPERQGEASRWRPCRQGQLGGPHRSRPRLHRMWLQKFHSKFPPGTELPGRTEHGTSGLGSGLNSLHHSTLVGSSPTARPWVCVPWPRASTDPTQLAPTVAPFVSRAPLSSILSPACARPKEDLQRDFSMGLQKHPVSRTCCSRPGLERP